MQAGLVALRRLTAQTVKMPTSDSVVAGVVVAEAAVLLATGVVVAMVAILVVAAAAARVVLRLTRLGPEETAATASS
jgi:hypothetical protein